MLVRVNSVGQEFPLIPLLYGDDAPQPFCQLHSFSISFCLRTFSVSLCSATKVHRCGGCRQSSTIQPLRGPELHSGLHCHRGQASTSGELDPWRSTRGLELELIFFIIAFALFLEECNKTVEELLWQTQKQKRHNYEATLMFKLSMKGFLISTLQHPHQSIAVTLLQMLSLSCLFQCRKPPECADHFHLLAGFSPSGELQEGWRAYQCGSNSPVHQLSGGPEQKTASRRDQEQECGRAVEPSGAWHTRH